MKKKLVTTTFVMTLLLTGCGSSDDDKNISKNTGKGTFTAGMEYNYTPFNQQTRGQAKTSVSTGDAGFCNGYDIHVARQTVKDLDREIVIKKVSWNDLQPALESGEIDAITTGMTEDEVREDGIDFTSSYYKSETAMIVRKGDRATRFNDIRQFKSKIIIRQRGMNYGTIISQIKGVKHMTPKTTYPEMILSLQNEEVDSITAELSVAEDAVEANKDLTIVHSAKGKGFDIDTSVSIGLKKGGRDSELLDAVQKSLDGASKEARDRWMKGARESRPGTE